MKTLFLDLDGTVREPASGAKFISRPYDQRIIEGANDALEYYHSKKWKIIGITNQGGVAAGHKTLLDALVEQRITMGLLPQLEAIYLCPDWEGNLCYIVLGPMVSDYKEIDRRDWFAPNDKDRLLYNSFRKPGSGMIEMAMDDYGCGTETWFVGDREEDALAAAGAGIKFMWADVWRDRFKKGMGGVDLSNRHMDKEILLKFLAT
jgi:D-glycero-D-manno-heptose 1,7-bisphosphate phosphatase